MSALTEITNEAAFTSHLSSLPPTTLLIISFYTPWAAPCTQMRAVLSALASKYPATSPPTTSFVTVNAEELPDISERYEVTAVPYLVLMRGGQVISTVSGSDVLKVRGEIEKYAGPGNAAATLTTAAPPVIPSQLSATPNQNAPAPAVSSTTVTARVSTAPASEPAAPPSKEELFERLAQLVKAAPVMLFMKGTPSAPQCGFSRQIVALLRENGVKYGFFNILADEDVRQGLKEFADWPTFPQLWIKGELVGGLDIVREELAADPDFFKPYAVVPAS
ncbi:monothiol glutaredoxin grx4 [Ascosphaera aggregata]|nr:monothiol glutaredoxin grx4 [Ascosphaera aggregata]